MRRVMQEAQLRTQNIPQPVYLYHPYSQPVMQKQQPQDNLDNKILQAEMELTRLKEMKQQSLRQEFERKKM